MWISEGSKLNPPNGEILADIGTRPAGSFGANLVLTSDVAVVVGVEHRNALNNANVERIVVNQQGGTTTTFTLGDVDLAEGERVRVALMGAIVGRVQATLVT